MILWSVLEEACVLPICHWPEVILAFNLTSEGKGKAVFLCSLEMIIVFSLSLLYVSSSPFLTSSSHYEDQSKSH